MIVAQKILEVLVKSSSRTAVDIAQDLTNFDFDVSRGGFAFGNLFFFNISAEQFMFDHSVGVYDTRGDLTADGCMCFVLVSGPVVFSITYLLRRRIIIVMEAGKVRVYTIIESDIKENVPQKSGTHEQADYSNAPNALRGAHFHFHTEMEGL